MGSDIDDRWDLHDGFVTPVVSDTPFVREGEEMRQPSHCYPVEPELSGGRPSVVMFYEGQGFKHFIDPGSIRRWISVLSQGIGAETEDDEDDGVEALTYYLDDFERVRCIALDAVVSLAAVMDVKEPVKLAKAIEEFILDGKSQAPAKVTRIK